MRFSAAGVRTTAAGRARVFVSTVIAFIPVCSSQATFRSCGAQSRRSDAALASLDSLGADGQARLHQRFKPDGLTTFPVPDSLHHSSTDGPRPGPKTD